jgi:hypothetical protein
MMPPAKPQPLTAQNYREQMSGVIDSVRRLEKNKGSEASLGSLCEGIASAYWHFGDPEAAGWFERALRLYRASISDPTIKVALLLWKMGDRGAFREECEKVLAFNLERIEDLAAGRLELPRQAFAGLPSQERLQHARRMFQTNVLQARYLLGDYETAQRDAGTLETATVIRHLCAGLLQDDGSVFRKGLEMLRKVSARWPTDGSSVPEDLYRFSLALGAKHFPAVIAEAEPLGNGAGRGASV